MSRLHKGKPVTWPSVEKTGKANPVDALRESEARMRAILETVVDAIITISDRGIVQSFNPAAERVFGYKAADVIGRNVSMLMPNPHSHHHDEYMHRYLETGRARIIGIGREVVGKRKDGTLFPMELAVSDTKLKTKRIFTGIVRDVTERKKAEEAITSIAEKERRRFGQELHDSLGQQLTGLSLLMKALETKLAPMDRAAHAQAKDLSHLTSRVLDEVKLQAHGLYPIELERHGLSAALSELAFIQERLFSVSCTYEALTPLPTLETHEALQLYRIAQEAVNNAIKHGRGTVIKMSVSHDTEEALRLTIEDNGSGLPDNAHYKGGMGLSIMRYRANTLGAKMEFRRGVRGGTVVTCIWFRAEPKQPRPQLEIRHGKKRQNSKK